MQVLQQTMGLPFFHHEAQVEVARGLADQVNTMLGEGFQRRTDFVQRSANLATDQAHHFCVGNDLDAAQAFQAPLQPRHHVGVHGLRGNVQRDGDVTFRSGNQIDGQTQVTEAAKGLRQKAHLVPHAHGFHGHHRDPAPAGQCRYARRIADRDSS